MNKPFIPARGFDALAAQGRRVQKAGSPLWLPVFDDREDALAFARYVGGFARRVVVGAQTRASCEWSDNYGGERAVLSIQFPGWGWERGFIVCEDNKAIALGVTHGERAVLLPIKQHKYTARTRSGTLYIGYEDGTAFCRSRSDGPLAMAKALYFARSESNALSAKERGGELEVVEQPEVGYVPLYVNGNLPKKGGRGLVFERESFRLGTKIDTITPA